MLFEKEFILVFIGQLTAS